MVDGQWEDAGQEAEAGELVDAVDGQDEQEAEEGT